MNKITAQVGQIIEVNGKQFKATEGGFEPVVSKGPLGGELKEVGVCLPHEMVHYYGRSDTLHFGRTHGGTMVETNIPARPTFTPMTAGEAAKLPDIVGRWIAVKVDDSSPETPGVPLSASGCWFRFKDQILLIEGADL